VLLEGEGWYEASVEARVDGIAAPRHSVFAQVAQHFLVPEARSGDWITLRRRFRHEAAERDALFELYLRSTRAGSVAFRCPRVSRISPPKRRVVRVATARFGSPGTSTMEGQRGRIADILDRAGAQRPDIALLPEYSPVIGVPEASYGNHYDAAEEVPGGPVCSLLAAKAAAHSMYVIAGVLERRGGYLYNTAVLFDRGGRFVGQYDKTHPTIGEALEGFSSGSLYPVFDLDFGRIAIHICYDEWFPEVSRLFAHKGAEILFLPVAGGKPITWRTRALDNGLYFVSASIDPPSMIIDSSGSIIAQTNSSGVVAADLDLDRREVNWYRDPTVSFGMPCIMPEMRNVLDDRLTEEMARLSAESVRFP
jgi:predicted amidohydrolase